MKKFLFFTFILSLLFTVSCKDKEKYGDRSPVVTQGYVRLYEPAAVQKEVALDPANVAFRFNVMLSEAVAQGVQDLDPVTVSKLKVKVSGKTVNLHDVLFKDTVIISRAQGDPGLYTLKFTEAKWKEDKNQKDNVRRGEMLIQTGNKLLGELAEGESWKLYSNQEDKKYILSDLYSIMLPVFNSESESYYYITGSGKTNEWNIKSPKLELYADNVKESPGEWYMNITVAQSSGSQAFGDISGSSFNMTGSGSGQIMNQNYVFGYDIVEKLLYKPSCNDLRVYGGQDKVKSHSTLPDYFLGNEVVVTHRNPDGCIKSLHITYAGMEYQTGGKP